MQKDEAEAPVHKSETLEWNERPSLLIEGSQHGGVTTFVLERGGAVQLIFIALLLSMLPGTWLLARCAIFGRPKMKQEAVDLANT